jgi:hypothetical protein
MRKFRPKEVANFIKQDFYVDNALKSVTTVPQAVLLIRDSKDMLAQGVSAFTNLSQIRALCREKAD